MLVNNAGILRDRSFRKMTLDDWDIVMNVHMNGTAYVTHA
ncbi:MAG: SDR family NAD(P)-dependent oxidoreductase, partial [Gammaproteobacteria bacterium]|nr:SDR family NAD(P)-dependent oxidoreductase [Gammaproteobacteria bacterium]